MEYYFNEYSLDGQFDSLEDFYKNCREEILPILSALELMGDVRVFKEETFWSRKVCNQYSLQEVLRTPPSGLFSSRPALDLKHRIFSYICKGPFNRNEVREIEIREHKFDGNPEIHMNRKNSFYQVAVNSKERRLISFKHDRYSKWQLRVSIISAEEPSKVEEIDLTNIYSPKCWMYVKEIKKWPLLQEKYLVEVRANEPARHEPHFHVTDADKRGMVFDIKDGTRIEPNIKDNQLEQWQKDMQKVVDEWYPQEKKQLEKAWNILHDRLHQG